MFSLNSTGSFFKDLYYCPCLYECLNKYVTGVISLLFVILFGVAIYNIRRNRSMQVDVRDKLLLTIALI